MTASAPTAYRARTVRNLAPILVLAALLTACASGPEPEMPKLDGTSWRLITFDGNPAGCATAYHLDQCYNAASCWYDADSETCNGCGPNNQQDGACVNTCSTGPASCDMDTSRILFGGGPGTGACFEFDDQASCLAAFHVGQCGVASCYWTGGSCQGCGPNNELSGDCFNTCEAP